MRANRLIKTVRYQLIITAVIGLAIALLFVLFTRSQTADAANAKDFKPGYIIDDAVFYNSNSMTSSQIQSFLNSKVPSCDTNGTKPATDWGRSDISHATLAYYIRNGLHGYTKNTNFHAPPYTCLKNFKQNTPQMEAASGLCGSLTAKTGRTSAQIISDVAKACGISPKVLLVLLQKEQSLVTDTWPLRIQYRNATGFACPDTAPCDPRYNGFFYQVYHAARQFKVYKKYPTDYNYIAGRTNRIYWNPDLSRCGSSNVYIQNQATAALYIYTPYRPNQAALNNLYGTGDSCSSYGNRNFWRLFTDWFGSTKDEYSYRFERLVGKNGSVIDRNASLGSYTDTVATGNKIYTFYYDSTNKRLRYAYWNGERWSDHLLDGQGASTEGSVDNDVGAGIKATYWNGQIQVFYYDASGKNLRHAWLRSGVWNTETLDGETSSVSKQNGDVGNEPYVITHNGGLQLFYYDKTVGGLKHAWWSGDGKWRFEMLDGSPESISGNPNDVGTSVQVLHYNGGLQLFYYDKTVGGLKHAWWSGDGKWRFEMLDGTAGSLGKRSKDMGSAVSATLYKGNLQVYYFNKTDGELVHAWWRDRKWNFETLDGKASSVIGNVINAGKDIVIREFNKDLFVFYFDDASIFTEERSNSWRVAHWDGGNWYGSNLDGGIASISASSAAVGGQLSLDIYKDRSLQIFYKDSTNAIRHAWINK